MDLIVLGVSIVLQLIAAVLALRLIRISGASTAWILIAIAISLMAIRRSITFFNMITGDVVKPADLTAELVALSISVFMVVGIALIRPLFIAMQQSQREIIEREENLSTMANSAGDGILVIVEGRHVFANDKIYKMLGYDAGELLDTGMEEVVAAEDYPGFSALYHGVADNSESDGIYETELRRKEGGIVPVELSAVNTLWHGKPAGMLIIRDIADRRASEMQMQQLSRAMQQTADTVIITNAEGEIDYVNRAFEDTTGYKSEEVLGKNTRILNSGKHDEAFYAELWETIKKGMSYHNVLINRKKDGSVYYEEKTITPLKDDSDVITHFIATGKDITEKMQAQERLHHLAYHDVLTGLSNRALFVEHLSRAVNQRIEDGIKFAILYIDLDHFKTINDTLGHNYGDRLLQQFSARLEQNVRKGDLIARFGGDEFAILTDITTDCHASSKLAEKVLKLLDDFFMIDEHEFYVTASIGISLYPDDADEPNTLIKYSDIAMYRAKDIGRNNYQYYSKDLSKKAFIRLNLESSLRRALEKGEFVIFYQPQVDIDAGKIMGFEALIRWQHPEKGLIPPDQFIPLLEDSGMIVPVGKWILRTACLQAKKWQEACGYPLSMAVNLSARQFYDPDLVNSIDRVLEEIALPVQSLELEMTESVLMQNDRISIKNLSELSSRGIRLSIDDFGTGYSSLSYLKRFPVNTLKIDREFIRDIVDDTDDASIVTAIISMAQSLKLDVVAEGVETVEQLNFIKACMCGQAQGFLFSRPLPAAEIDEMIAQKVSYASYCIKN